jgi:hypothetical protein
MGAFAIWRRSFRIRSSFRWAAQCSRAPGLPTPGYGGAKNEPTRGLRLQGGNPAPISRIGRALKEQFQAYDRNCTGFDLKQLALAIVMVRRRGGKRPHARKRKNKATVRAPAKAPKKAETIAKKTRQFVSLDAKGGGHATAAGVSFQASVGAIFAVQMLTESFGDQQLGLPPFKVQTIRFESDAPLDDIIVETDQNGWLLLQAKTKLSLSTSLTSEFGKTALQIVRQWHAGLQGSSRRGWDRPLSLDHDRLVIAVGPGTAQTLTIDLAKALASLRANATAPLPLKQRSSLKIMSDALKRAWTAVTGKMARAADIANILPFISVLRFDIAGPDRAAAIAQLRLLTTNTQGAHGSFVALERECQTLMERRHGADAATLRRAISQAGIALKAAPSYQRDVEVLRKYSERIANELTAFEATFIDGKPITIDRAATKAVVRAAENGSLLVIGEPGSGKSAVVSAAASTLRTAQADVIQFAVDRLPVETADGLRAEIGLKHRLADILENWPSTKPAYLFIDALDATRGGRGEAVFRSLIKDVMGLPSRRWRVIASIRSFDLKVGEQFRELFSGAPADNAFKDNAFPTVRHINVPSWSEAEFEDLLTRAESLATAIAQGGAKLRDLAGVPFNSRLLADLLSTGVPATAFGAVGSQVELLAIYWARRVAPLGNAADVCLRATVELMVRSHTLQAERLQVATTAPSALDALFKANVLVPVIADRYVSFRHHILFDYAASRLFINPLDIGSIRTRLVAQPGLALMLAPALAYALHDLWLNSSSNKSEFWAAVVELSGKSPSDPVARSVAARMASVLPAEPEDTAELARLVDSNTGSSEAAKTFVHLVGALTVGIEDKVLTAFAPWCMLAAGVAARVDAVAWPLRTLLWQIVGMVTAAEQRTQLGTAARALLIFALNDSRGASLATVAIELVSDTYETDADASRELLQRLFVGDRFAAHAHEDMPALARKAKRLLGYDPDFVAEVYRVVFSKRVIDTSATSMGNSQILPLSSNRQQDYNHARWQLSQYVPGLLDTEPELGIRLLTIAAEGLVESEHPTDAEVVAINVDSKTAHLLDDGSHVWAHNPDDPYAHAENLAGLIGSFKRRLLESPPSQAVNLALITAATNRLAVLWARMFLAAAQRSDVLGAIMVRVR